MQEFELGSVHAFVITRIVPEPAVEPNGPDDADKTKQTEGPPPGHEGEDPHDEQRRERPAPAPAQPHYAHSAAALAAGQPIREHFGQVWKATGFPGAKEKARYQQ